MAVLSLAAGMVLLSFCASLQIGGIYLVWCALRAFAKLDADRAISAAIAALADDASSVRSASVGILATDASRVDFDTVSRQVRSLSDAKARGNLNPGAFSRAQREGSEEDRPE